jgi:hypothetical protein
MRSGRSVSYIPPGLLKSGMPDAILALVPVNATTELHCGDVMNRAMP